MEFVISVIFAMFIAFASGYATGSADTMKSEKCENAFFRSKK